MRGWDVSGIPCEDSGGRKCFLGTLEEDDDGPGEFGEDSRHKEYQNEQEETETKGAEDSHRNVREMGKPPGYFSVKVPPLPTTPPVSGKLRLFHFLE